MAFLLSSLCPCTLSGLQWANAWQCSIPTLTNDTGHPAPDTSEFVQGQLCHLTRTLKWGSSGQMENGAEIIGWPESYEQVNLPNNWNLATSRWKHIPRFFLTWHVRAELCAMTTGRSQLVRSHTSSVPCSHRRPPLRALTRSCPFPPACCPSPRLRQHVTCPHCLSTRPVSPETPLTSCFFKEPSTPTQVHPSDPTLFCRRPCTSFGVCTHLAITPCLFLMGLWLISYRAT